MNKFNPDEFMHYANTNFLRHPGHLRYGQFLMNYLYQEHPEIEVPIHADCYARNDKVPNFLRFIYSLGNVNV